MDRLNEGTRQILNQQGAVDLKLKDASDDSARFCALLDSARNANQKNGWAVSPQTPQSLAEEGTRVFRSLREGKWIGHWGVAREREKW